MATSIQLRKINRNNVFRSILKLQRTSKQQLASALHLSYPTVSQALEDLSAKGLITNEGVFQSTGGRKAQVVSACTDAFVSIGLAITNHHVSIVMIDLAMHILGSVRERILFEMNDRYFETLREMVDQLVGAYQEQVLGIVVSIPAIVDGDGKHVLYAPLLHTPSDLYEQLTAHLPYPLELINDASACAYSELSQGHSRKNFLYLMLSNSVGGAVIINGSMVEGEHFRGGEFGHMTLIPNGRKCYCGQKGCVDAYCSALCLSNDLEAFFRDLEQGDETCQKKWQEYIEYLSIVINNLQISTNCEIVLGGYVGWFIKPYMDRVRAAVRARSSFPDEPTISVGSFDTEASALGAAMIFLNRFIEQV